MKYRRLEQEELDNLQENFVRFLASQSIAADDWENIKANDTARVDNLVEAFSDLVIGGTLKNIKYLRIVMPKDIKTFLCDEENITMRGLSVKEGEEIQFDIAQNEVELLKIIGDNLEKIEAYELSKSYNGDRDMELYQMLENGCRISDGKIHGVVQELLIGIQKMKEED